MGQPALVSPTFYEKKRQKVTELVAAVAPSVLSPLELNSTKHFKPFSTNRTAGKKTRLYLYSSTCVNTVFVIQTLSFFYTQLIIFFPVT